MKKIYSNLDPSRVLHFVLGSEDFGSRVELIDAGEMLQLSSQLAASGTSFRAHRHLVKSVNITEITAQESWVVVSGRVKVTFYDTDDSFLDSVELSAGDVSVTLAGGHGYDIIEESRILEFKTGPYLGRDLDKKFIDVSS